MNLVSTLAWWGGGKAMLERAFLFIVSHRLSWSSPHPKVVADVTLLGLGSETTDSFWKVSGNLHDLCQGPGARCGLAPRWFCQSLHLQFCCSLPTSYQPLDQICKLPPGRLTVGPDLLKWMWTAVGRGLKWHQCQGYWLWSYDILQRKK